MNPSADQPVLLFDGACGLCLRAVRLLRRLDRRQRLKFAALQGDAGQAYLRRQGLPTATFDSLVLVPDWHRPAPQGYLLETDGVVAALRVCGGLGTALAAVLGAVPTRWRNAGYRLVARWRRVIFGAGPGRPFAGPKWAGRLLD